MASRKPSGMACPLASVTASVYMWIPTFLTREASPREVPV